MVYKISFTPFCIPFSVYILQYLFHSFTFQVQEVYSKDLKGAISALASLQGHLLIASGPKIILHRWTGTELNGVAFFDVPPLYVVSLNIVCTTSYCTSSLFIYLFILESMDSNLKLTELFISQVYAVFLESVCCVILYKQVEATRINNGY